MPSNISPEATSLLDPGETEGTAVERIRECLHKAYPVRTCGDNPQFAQLLQRLAEQISSPS